MVIAVDMTDYIPGGVNGGVAPLAKETIKGLGKIDGNRIIVLTTNLNENDLNALESKNIKCVCVKKIVVQDKPSQDESKQESMNDNQIPLSSDSLWNKSVAISKKVLPKVLLGWGRRYKHRILKTKNVFAHPINNAARPLYRRFKAKFKVENTKAAEQGMFFDEKELLNAVNKQNISELVGEKIDVLYCPFTAINYWDKNISTFIQLNDIQHRYCPWFFSSQELVAREKFYQTIALLEPNIISISDYSKKTFVEQYSYDSDKITTIYPSIQNRFNEFSVNERDECIRKLGLKNQKYILYTANFWPHKNHKSLFVAFSILTRSHPENDIKLVLTGFSGDFAKLWEEDAKALQIDDKVMMLGYVSDIELNALLENAYLFVFPSYFEGFGMPITEAMSSGTPILCADDTSLPEVAGNCAYYFDPYNPYDLYKNMELLIYDESMRKGKIEGYKECLSKFSFDKSIDELQKNFVKSIMEGHNGE